MISYDFLLYVYIHSTKRLWGFKDKYLLLNILLNRKSQAGRHLDLLKKQCFTCSVDEVLAVYVNNYFLLLSPF